jgi:hypothetical protein
VKGSVAEEGAPSPSAQRGSGQCCGRNALVETPFLVALNLVSLREARFYCTTVNPVQDSRLAGEVGYVESSIVSSESS